jgi:hypothetical protein
VNSAAPVVGLATWSAFRAKAAHQIDDQGHQQDQTDATATKGRTADIETAAAEQEKQNDDYEEKIHDGKLAGDRIRSYGVLTSGSLARVKGGFHPMASGAGFCHASLPGQGNHLHYPWPEFS